MFDGHDKLWVIHIGMDDKIAIRALHLKVPAHRSCCGI
jgi:hypothetical protein